MKQVGEVDRLVQHRVHLEKAVEMLNEEYTVEGAVLDDLTTSLMEGAVDNLGAFTSETAAVEAVDGREVLRTVWESASKSMYDASGKSPALEMKTTVINQAVQDLKAGVITGDAAIPESMIRVIEQTPSGDYLFGQLAHRCEDTIVGLKPALATIDSHTVGTTIKSSLGPLVSVTSAAQGAVGQGFELVHALSTGAGGVPPTWVAAATVVAAAATAFMVAGGSFPANGNGP